jgi:diadenosine tetraphosphatase ApaH/serine/threonine PP2A family protein phosphatase
VRIGVIADIHGNLDAFEAVVADAGAIDFWWCLGDVVGYGADPNGCMALLRSLPHVALPGNHDLAAAGILDVSDFNPDAQTCITWTAKRLCGEHVTYLRSLPERLALGAYTLVHASPRAPVWEYITTGRQARANFAYFDTRICLVGHTHVPAAYDEQGRQDFARAASSLYESAGTARFLCNPGAVGQPRDGDPRASYLLLDDDERRWEWRRVAYDIRRATTRILEAGLPEVEAQRLFLGR